MNQNSPDSCYSSYAIYKESTQKVFNWISSNASLVAKNPKSMTISAIQGLVEKLKLRPNLEMPSDMIWALKQAISSRNAYYNFFSGLTAQEPNPSRRRALENIYQHFRNEDEEEGSAEFLELQNRFEGLTVRDPVFETTLDFTPTAKDTAVDPQLDKDLEKLFAIFCLFQDLDTLQKFLQKRWEDYARGKVSLMAVSFTTSQVSSIVLALESQLEVNFGLRGVYEVVEFVRECVSASEASQELKESMMLQEISLLESFKRVLKDGQAPVMRPGHYGTYNANSDRSRMGTLERRQEDMILLLENFPEWTLYAKLGWKLPIEGEFEKHFRPFTQSAPTTVWMAFQCRVYLTVIHCTRPNTKRGFDEMQVLAQQMHDSVDRYLKDPYASYHPLCKADFEENRTFAKNWKDELTNTVFKDIAIKSRQDFHRMGIRIAEHDIFIRNPWLSGVTMYTTLFEYHHLGIQIMRNEGVFMASLHLYNALIQLKVLSPVPVYEKFIKIFGKKVFSGDAPEDNFLKRFSVSLGVKMEMFAKTRGQERQKGSGLKHNPAGRGFDTGDISMLFKVFQKEASVKEILRHRGEKGGKNLTSREDYLLSIQNIAVHDFSNHHIGMDLLDAHGLALNILRILYKSLKPYFDRYFEAGMIQYETQLPFVAGSFLMLAENFPILSDEKERIMEAASSAFSQGLAKYKGYDFVLTNKWKPTITKKEELAEAQGRDRLKDAIRKLRDENPNAYLNEIKDKLPEEFSSTPRAVVKKIFQTVGKEMKNVVVAKPISKKKPDAASLPRSELPSFYPGPPGWLEDPDALYPGASKFLAGGLHQRGLDMRTAYMEQLYRENGGSNAPRSLESHVKLMHKAGLVIVNKAKITKKHMDGSILLDQRQFNDLVDGMQASQSEPDLSALVRRCDTCSKPTICECQCGESYCSRKCQLQDWDFHKDMCDQVSKAIEGSIFLSELYWHKKVHEDMRVQAILKTDY